MLVSLQREREAFQVLLDHRDRHPHRINPNRCQTNLVSEIPNFLDFFPQVLLISVPARMGVQFEGGNKTRAGSISLGSACSLEC